MNLEAAVILLHDIARSVEQQIGTGQLSDDVRSCANRLSDLLKPMQTENKEYDPTI